MLLKDQIVALKEKCLNCQECPLGRRNLDGFDPHVFGSGNIKADIMVVAEAPGYNETVEKKVLVGRAGQFYNEKILKIANIERKSVFTTNAALCRPPNNRKPLPGELETCLPLLDSQVVLVDPKLIVILGNVPLYSVCDIPPSGITKYHGILRLSREWSDGKKRLVFPMFHPGYCLRGSGLKEVKEDALGLGFFVRQHLSKSLVELHDFAGKKLYLEEQGGL